MEFVVTPGTYDTSVRVRAIAAQSTSVPVVVHCKYYYMELDPITGRYIYERSGFEDWKFYIKDNGPQSIEVYPSSLTMNMGDSSYGLTATAYPSTASSSVTWSVTSGYDVVSVSSSGYVSPKKPGDAVVTATSTVNGVTGSCRVHVNSVSPTGISISPSSRQSLAINSTLSFSYSLTPSYATSSVTWSMTGDTDAATLSSSGVLRGEAVGTVRVTATTSNGYSASCYVDVYKPVPSRIELNKPTLRLPVGATETLTYSVTPSNAIYTVSWDNDAPDVVSANNGLLEAKKPGTAHITVTTDNGKSATCEVTVPPEPTAMKLNPAEIELLMGRSKTLAYSFEPTDAATASIRWESSDTQIATVNQQGVVSALRPGIVTVTATARNGVVGRCRLTVPLPLYQLFVWTKAGIKTGYLSTDEPHFSVVGDIVRFTTSRLSMDIRRDTLDKFTLEQVLPEHPKRITLPEKKSVALGSTVQLKAELTPADAETSLTWFNDNPEVVSVTQDGRVTALQVGEASLMVQTSNGLRAKVHVVVPEPRLRFYVWMRNGEVHGYDLEEKPEVKLGEEFFTLTSSRQTVQYQAADILRFTLQDAVIEEEIADGIAAPIVTDNLEFREGTLLIAGSRPYGFVQVYDTAGRLVQTAKADGDGNLSLSLASLREGIYIIRTETTTIKIQKR